MSSFSKITITSAECGTSLANKTINLNAADERGRISSFLATFNSTGSIVNFSNISEISNSTVLDFTSSTTTHTIQNSDSNIDGNFYYFVRNCSGKTLNSVTNEYRVIGFSSIFRNYIESNQFGQILVNPSKSVGSVLNFNFSP